MFGSEWREIPPALCRARKEIEDSSRFQQQRVVVEIARVA
jgi:hypothetical protein